jgi:hypothetical protein
MEGDDGGRKRRNQTTDDQGCVSGKIQVPQCLPIKTIPDGAFYDPGPALTTHGLGQQRGTEPQLMPRIPIL